MNRTIDDLQKANRKLTEENANLKQRIQSSHKYTADLKEEFGGCGCRCGCPICAFHTESPDAFQSHQTRQPDGPFDAAFRKLGTGQNPNSSYTSDKQDGARLYGSRPSSSASGQSYDENLRRYEGPPGHR